MSQYPRGRRRLKITTCSNAILVTRILTKASEEKGNDGTIGELMPMELCNVQENPSEETSENGDRTASFNSSDE